MRYAGIRIPGIPSHEDCPDGPGVIGTPVIGTPVIGTPVIGTP